MAEALRAHEQLSLVAGLSIDHRELPEFRPEMLRGVSTDLEVLGMFVTLEFQAASDRRRLLVSRAGVQAVGERAMVYIAADDGDGRFIERPVKIGTPVGGCRGGRTG